MKRLKERLKAIGSMIEQEPVILLKGQGGVWISDKGKSVISKKKINIDDFLGWLNIGAKHLLKSSYCGMEVAMMRFPDKSNDILVILGQECETAKEFNLTLREKEILGCLLKGMSNKEIAGCLNISPGTVNTHLDRVYGKLGASNRVKACCMALKTGLAVPQDMQPTPKSPKTKDPAEINT